MKRPTLFVCIIACVFQTSLGKEDPTFLGFRIDQEPIGLENGVPTGPLSLSTDASIVFQFDRSTPVADVYCLLRGGYGDADLYLSWGEVPDDASEFDCMSTNPSSDEFCAVPSPGISRLFVVVFAYTNFQDAVLTCTERNPFLANHVATDPFSLPDQQRFMFTYAAETGSTPVRCTLNAEGGNPDLYLIWGDGLPGVCTSANEDSNESCEVENPNDGSDLFVFVYARSAFDSAVLICDEDIPTPSSCMEACNGLFGEGISLWRDEDGDCRERCVVLDLFLGFYERFGWQCGTCAQ